MIDSNYCPIASVQTPDAFDDPFIDISEVGYTYPNGLRALDGLSLQLGRGRATAIVGPSGCGKSTLLRIVAGLVSPTSGQFQCNFAPSRHALTMVFQGDTLLPWLRVRDNVALYYKFHPRQRSREEIRRRVDELLAMVGLSKFGDAYPRALSGGMRRRVAFLAGVAPSPQLLLLDEPFSSVDEPTRVKIHGQVRSVIDDSKMTTILVTHDLAEALSLAHEVLVLSARPGQVVTRHEVTLNRDEDILKLRESREFLDLYAEVWDSLSTQIRRSDDDDNLELSWRT